MSATILHFPRRSAVRKIEVFEQADRSGWLALVTPDEELRPLSAEFRTYEAALAYAWGLQVGTDWAIVDWTADDPTEKREPAQ